uniref:Uncharacterized protein n=1 Tax=Anguilla anguilla TaxID=7936 RepID=A0A0E9VVN5_ANGAN
MPQWQCITCERNTEYRYKNSGLCSAVTSLACSK